MVFALVRIGLLWLRRLGFDVPTIPTLRRRQTLLEQFLTPPPVDPRPNATPTVPVRRGVGRTRFRR